MAQAQAIQTVIDYLINQIDSTHVNRPTANSGAVIIKSLPNWKFAVKTTVYDAVNTLSMSFTKDYPGQPQGLTKLTSTATHVGDNYFNKFLPNNEPDFQQATRVGAIILDAFAVTGFVEILKVPGFSMYSLSLIHI